jgi:hypothetical protein
LNLLCWAHHGKTHQKLAFAAAASTRFSLVKGEGIARRSVFTAAACFENVHSSSSFAEINALVMWDFSFKELDK